MQRLILMVTADLGMRRAKAEGPHRNSRYYKPPLCAFVVRAVNIHSHFIALSCNKLGVGQYNTIDDRMRNNSFGQSEEMTCDQGCRNRNVNWTTHSAVSIYIIKVLEIVASQMVAYRVVGA